MPEVVLLRDILMHDEEACSLFVNYEPNMSNKLEIDVEEYSNIVKKETVTPEQKLAWHPCIYDGKICIVSDPTEFKLQFLKASNTKISQVIMKQRLYAGIYARMEFGTTPIPLKREVFMNLPTFLKEVEGKYWIEDSKQFCWVESRKIDLSQIEQIANIDEAIDYSICLTECNCYDEGSKLKIRRSMRMITTLPIDIKVIIGEEERDGSSQEKALSMTW